MHYLKGLFWRLLFALVDDDEVSLEGDLGDDKCPEGPFE